jgi:hypothetical protein
MGVAVLSRVVDCQLKFTGTGFSRHITPFKIVVQVYAKSTIAKGNTIPLQSLSQPTCIFDEMSL